MRKTFPGRSALWTKWASVLWTALSAIVRQRVSRLLAVDRWRCLHCPQQELVCPALLVRLLRRSDGRTKQILRRRLKTMLQNLLRSISDRIKAPTQETIRRQSRHRQRNSMKVSRTFARLCPVQFCTTAVILSFVFYHDCKQFAFILFELCTVAGSDPKESTIDHSKAITSRELIQRPCKHLHAEIYTKFNWRNTFLILVNFVLNDRTLPFLVYSVKF